MQIHAAISDQKTAMVTKVADGFDSKIEDATRKRLGGVYTMANEFRCYALRRIDYFNRQKELSIISVKLLWRWANHAKKEDAFQHFEETASRCSPERRPA
jgi:hypothetical protein